MNKNVLSFFALCLIFIVGCDRKAPDAAHTSTSSTTGMKVVALANGAQYVAIMMENVSLEAAIIILNH